MSDLPGEITKQMRVAPAISMRSTRYSLTARGRSASPSRRLPTGSSSLLNASGWMRLPTPAAGTMPHMPTSSEHLHELLGAPLGGVIGQRAPLRRLADARQLARRERQRLDGLLGRPGEEDL